MKNVKYGMHKELPGKNLSQAEERVVEALKGEGFGVLTKIDVKETLKKKLDVDHRPYLILGACNPNLAHKALSHDDNIGLLLPCNVVVAETPEGAEVSIARPDAMFEPVGDPELRPVADEAQARLQRVLDAI